MKSLKEQYWKYSLIGIILFLGIVIFQKITPFLGGFLGASTLYILLRGQAFYLTEKRHWKKWLMAVVLLLETILFCLIPIALVVWLFINKLKAVDLDPQSLLVPIQHLADLVHEKTGYELMSRGNMNALVGMLP